jgi:hypothetical protein
VPSACSLDESEHGVDLLLLAGVYQTSLENDVPGKAAAQQGTCAASSRPTPPQTPQAAVQTRTLGARAGSSRCKHVYACTAFCQGTRVCCAAARSWAGASCMALHTYAAAHRQQCVGGKEDQQAVWNDATEVGERLPQVTPADTHRAACGGMRFEKRQRGQQGARPAGLRTGSLAKPVCEAH